MKDFLRKVIVPVLLAWLLYNIFSSLFITDGEINVLYAWILCGFPFGVWHMHTYLMPSGGSSLGYSLAIWMLDFIIGGLIGGAILVWKLLCAAWFLLAGIYRLLVWMIENIAGAKKPSELYAQETIDGR